MEYVYLGIGLVALALLALVVLAARKPDTFRVSRSAKILAPPDRVFALLDDFHEWPKWSPWEKMDPTMSRSHGGPKSGVGAWYQWKGNSKVGEGRMEIKRASAPTLLVIKLDFLKPFEAHNTAEFTIGGDSRGSSVVWTMHGPQNFMFKFMTLFFSMDKAVGKDFEEGLMNLKRLCETEG